MSSQLLLKSFQPRESAPLNSLNHLSGNGIRGPKTRWSNLGRVRVLIQTQAQTQKPRGSRVALLVNSGHERCNQNASACSCESVVFRGCDAARNRGAWWEASDVGIRGFQSTHGWISEVLYEPFKG